MKEILGRLTEINVIAKKTLLSLNAKQEYATRYLNSL